MNRAKFFISLALVASILIAQVGRVFAAPVFQNSTPASGMVQSITLETDPTTGVTIVIVDLMNNDDLLQSVRVGQETAIALGLVVLNGDGKPGINSVALGRLVEIALEDTLPTQEEKQHPVGSALATFFSDVAGLDYGTIMAAHGQGIGFGVIAQTLWLTTKLDGDSNVFEALLQARKTKDYSAFILADGSSPANWAQLRDAISQNGNVGIVMSEKDDHGTGNEKENDKPKDKDKDKNNNGNNPGKDKEKDQEKIKDKEKDK